MSHCMFVFVSLSAISQLPDGAAEVPVIPFAESNCAVVSTLLAARYHRRDVTFDDVNNAFAPEWRRAGQLVPASAIVSAFRSIGIPSEVAYFSTAQGLSHVPQ